MVWLSSFYKKILYLQILLIYIAISKLLSIKAFCLKTLKNIIQEKDKYIVC